MMKITKADLKKIIEEELGEVIRPRMNLGSSGLRAPGVPAAPPPEAPTPSADSVDLRGKLMGMVMSYYKVSKADPNVPSHVLRAFERLAQEIAKP
jgi:hypothetical protein